MSGTLELEVTADHAVPVTPAAGGTLTILNQSGDTLYYADNAQVSAASNQGSLTATNSATFSLPQWIRSASLTTVQVTFIDPVAPTGGASGPSVVQMDSGTAPTIDHLTALNDQAGLYYDLLSGKFKGATFLQAPASPAVGDLNYVNATSPETLARLAVGSVDQLLTPSGGLPAWGTPTKFAPSGMTGATAASRYVGATTSGAPVSGTFAVGDFVIDRTGKVWVCTILGTPGTWTQVGGSGGGSSSPNPQPSDQGLIAWAVDPAFANSSFNPGAGHMDLFQMPVRSSQTFATAWISIATGGTGATALANCFLGLYVVSGANLQLIGSTADQSSAWATATVKSAALTVQGGQSLTQTTNVWMGVLVGTQSTTQVQVTAAGASAAVSNMGQVAGTNALRSATFGSGLTALPATAAISSLAAGDRMAAVAAS